MQIVFQDPYSCLNPMRTVGWTLQEALTTHSPRARNVGEKVADLLDVRRSPRELREAQAGRTFRRRAPACRDRPRACRQPQILICDEPVSALDMSVQAQILNLLAKLRAERGHQLPLHHARPGDRPPDLDFVYVMYRGKVVESGPTDDVLDRPQHSYTVSLLNAIPRRDGDWLGVAQPVGSVRGET